MFLQGNNDTAAFLSLNKNIIQSKNTCIRTTWIQQCEVMTVVYQLLPQQQLECRLSLTNHLYHPKIPTTTSTNLMFKQRAALDLHYTASF